MNFQVYLKLVRMLTALFLVTAFAYIAFKGEALHKSYGWSESVLGLFSILFLFTGDALHKLRINLPLMMAVVCASLVALGEEHRNMELVLIGRLGTVFFLIASYFVDSDFNDKWKRLWGKLRSAALTVINAASFQRQSQEVTS